MKVIPETSSAH